MDTRKLTVVQLSSINEDRLDIEEYNIIDCKGIVGEFLIFTTDDDAIHGLKTKYIVSFELTL